MSFLKKKCNNCKKMTPLNELWNFGLIYQCCKCYREHRCPKCGVVKINTYWFRWHCPECNPEKIKEDHVLYGSKEAV